MPGFGDAGPGVTALSPGPAVFSKGRGETIMAWPKKVPILEADDICRGKYRNDGQCCLLGWAHKVFGNNDFNYSTMLRTAEERVVIEDIRERIPGHMQIHTYSDASTPAGAADLWNRVMRKLGYTESCDR